MRRILGFLILYIPIAAGAQASQYPQGYFRNPLDIPISLAGNFGECRPGHFHSGLDIKTMGRENLRVYAAAEGYVSRIKMEPGGFGHGLYITHPNGYTTLYAHLNDFAPAIQRYVRRQQYAMESWTVDLSFTPEQFPVKKGQQIAWSGNTGGSTAPHLHFEIRDTKTEHPLNPQLFGFEIKDTRAPVVKELALYAGLWSKPKLIKLTKQGSIYRPSRDSLTMGSEIVGLGIVVDDFMEGSNNTLAFYTAEWYVDETLQGLIRLDNIGYDETRYLHAYADYRARQLGGPWIQQLFQLPGNRLKSIYESLNQNAGKFSFDDTLFNNDALFHNVRILVKDVYGNASEINFTLRIGPNLSHMDECLDRYWKVNEPVVVQEKNISFRLDENSLYNDACEPVRSEAGANTLSQLFTIGLPTTPVHNYFELSLKPDKLVPFSLRKKVAMIYSDDKTENGRAANPAQQGWYAANVRAFGNYWLAVDTSAPALKPVTVIKGDLSKAKSIAFSATDNMTSVKSFRGELDGKWLLFEQHGGTWTYVFDEHCPKGAHKLVVKATDENGNEAKASYTFTR
jgi:hypothetical protein